MTEFPEEFVPPTAHTGDVQLQAFDGSVREVGTALDSLAFN